MLDVEELEREAEEAFWRARKDALLDALIGETRD